MSGIEKTRVLVVDDSRTTRQHLVRLFNAEPDFEVVGEAETAAEAGLRARVLRPDLVSLDVFIPGGSAAEVVRSLLRLTPVPIVLVSHAPRTSAEVFEALAAGALDLVHKPAASKPASAESFLRLMRVLARVRVRPPKRAAGPKVSAARIVCIGSSTGGPAALREILGDLPADFPAPVVVAQHVAAGFEEPLGEWLGQATPLKVRVAGEFEQPQPGLVLLGRSGQDVLLDGTNLRQKKAPARGYHPSVNDLFATAAQSYGAGALGVVLSGIGEDGERGAREIVAAGGAVFAQDEASAAVFSMPQAVVKTGLASRIGSPKALARAIIDAVLRRE